MKMRRPRARRRRRERARAPPEAQRLLHRREALARAEDHGSADAPGALQVRAQREGEVLTMATPAQSALAKLPLPAKIGVGAGALGVVAFAYWFIFYSDVVEQDRRARTGRRRAARRARRSSSRPRRPTSPIAASSRSASSARASSTRCCPPDAEEDAFLSSVQQASNAAGIDLKGYAPLDEVAQSLLRQGADEDRDVRAGSTRSRSSRTSSARWIASSTSRTSS